MHDAVAVGGIAWLTVLIAVGVLRVIRASTLGERILAVDLVALLLIAIVGLIAARESQSGYLDAGLALALLSFVATMAAARSYGGGGPFR